MGMKKEEMSMISVKNEVGLVKGSGYVHGMSCISAIYSPEICKGSGEDGRFSVEERTVANEKKEELKGLNANSSSSSTSSIGKNSDISGSLMEKSGETEEVQSTYKGPLDAMEALEEVLPIRKGISRFYKGKSKSFASLRDASSTSSIKEVAKPENAYTRKRRNLLACSLTCLKTTTNKSSKKVISNSSTRTTSSLLLCAAVPESIT